ncbi:MAG TPA: T9SS type A sorting domain-containing protein, partial [Chitinophagaceae bacterium]|nr:T9SS type A sorting domain-containing protein [Chitinophagaceae bacterium]
AVQTRSLSTLSTDEVWLNIGATQSGNYTFNFSDYENFTGADIYLVDHLAKITQDVKANPDYVFSVDVNNAATKGSNRFSIVFTKRIVEPSIVNNNIKMYPNPANKQVTLLLPQIADINYNIKVTDMAGKIILQQNRAGGDKQLNIEKLSTGTYIVEIIDSKGNRTTEKLIKN